MFERWTAVVGVAVVTGCGVTATLPSNGGDAPVDGGTAIVDSGTAHDGGTAIVDSGTAHDGGGIDSGQLDAGPVVHARDAGGRPYVTYQAGAVRESSSSSTSGFTPPALKVDVLFVIDSSCSMSIHQMELMNAGPAFAAAAVASGADFHLGVTIADNDGILRGLSAPAFVTQTTPGLQTTLAGLFDVGLSGAGYEQLVDSALTAIQPSVSSSATNAGFLRSGARLAVIFVSDAIDAVPDPLQTHDSQFRAIAPRLRVSGIIPTHAMAPTGCYYDGTIVTPGLMDWVRSTGGVVGEICDASLSSSMQRVARSTFGNEAWYPLPSTPVDVSLIRVEVNGVLVPRLTGNVPNWEYDAAQNAVELLEPAWPAPGATVDIQY